MISLFSIADRIISLGDKIRPVWLKERLFSLLFSFCFYLNRLKVMLLQIRLRVFLVSGVEKNSDEPIRVLFVGCEDIPLFLVDLLFIKKPTVEPVGHVFIWRLNRLHRFSSDVDAVLVSVDHFYRGFLHRDDFFVFPHMVDMVLNCSQGLKEIMRKVSTDAKKEIRRVKNQDFSFLILR